MFLKVQASKTVLGAEPKNITINTDKILSYSPIDGERTRVLFDTSDNGFIHINLDIDILDKYFDGVNHFADLTPSSNMQKKYDKKD